MISDAIQLPDAPGIPGLKFRHFRGGRDYSHMATITRVSAEVDDTDRADTPEGLEKWFAHLTNCDPYKQRRVCYRSAVSTPRRLPSAGAAYGAGEPKESRFDKKIAHLHCVRRKCRGVQV